LKDNSFLWTPDTFFSNSIGGGFVEKEFNNDMLIRVFPDGQVLYSARITLPLDCPMDYTNFPFDSPICSIIFASYAYNTEELVYNWKNTDPIQVSKSLNLPNFILKKFTPRDCTSKTNTGEYSCMSVDLVFERKSNAYFLQIYIPLIMLVKICYLSFWVKETSTRYTFALTTLFVSGSGILLPQTSYTKAIDVWTGTCMAFMFTTLVIHVVMDYVNKTEQERTSNVEGTAGESSSKENSRTKRIKKWLSKNYSHLEWYSRILYPVLFFLFFILYFGYYRWILPSSSFDDADIKLIID